MEQKSYDLKEFENLKLRIVLDTEILFDWKRVAYLIPPILRRHQDIYDLVRNQIQRGDDKFNKFVATHVQKYIEEDVMPDASIAGPIINIAEDILAGREPTLRGGDYIALRNGMEM
jgi:hypothetical protein